MKMDLTSYLDDLDIRVVSYKKDELVFDLLGVDPSFANALRRILIAEVPTMAIERVFFITNTSIMADEILAHRLGLIPLKANAESFDYRDHNSDPVPSTTLVYHLDVNCTENERTVYAKDLKWVAQGNQDQLLNEAEMQPVNGDIIITKIRKGQSIRCHCHAEKGIGKVHAKWSPVCTASYRLLPDISFKKKVVGTSAESLVKKCPMGVFDIENLGKTKAAVVCDQRACTMCRECTREGDFADNIVLGRKENHYIFTVESVGQFPADDLVRQALHVLSEKANRVFTASDDNMMAAPDDVEGNDAEGNDDGKES